MRVDPSPDLSKAHRTAADGCAWTATSNDSWITVTSGASSNGNGTVTFDIEANGVPSFIHVSDGSRGFCLSCPHPVVGDAPIPSGPGENGRDVP